MEIKRCPICQKDELVLVFKTDRFPYIGFSVLKEERKKIIDRYSNSNLVSKLKILGCNNCKHAFQAMELNKELMDMIYSEFYNYPSPMLTGFSHEREKIFLEFFFAKISKIAEKKSLSKVLEIACFDGYVLHELEKKGFQVCGCDPSKGADIARRFGLKVYKRFFNSDDFISEGECFDIVIFRHFIEHIHNPIILLNEVKRVLTKEGLIIFETPNVEYYLESGSFESFNFQHLHNFSIYSVQEVLRRASLNLMEYQITPENLIAVAAKEGKFLAVTGDSWEKNVNNFKENFQKNLNVLHGYLEPFVKQKKKIVVWGAGGLCGYFFILYNVDEQIISYVVDSDERKWEMCFIDKKFEIRSPKSLASDNVDLIIITSMYSEEILKQICELQVKSDVISLHPYVSYIEKPAEHYLNL